MAHTYYMSTAMGGDYYVPDEEIEIPFSEMEAAINCFNCERQMVIDFNEQKYKCGKCGFYITQDEAYDLGIKDDNTEIKRMLNDRALIFKTLGKG